MAFPLFTKDEKKEESAQVDPLAQVAGLAQMLQGGNGGVDLATLAAKMQGLDEKQIESIKKIQGLSQTAQSQTTQTPAQNNLMAQLLQQATQQQQPNAQQANNPLASMLGGMDFSGLLQGAAKQTEQSAYEGTKKALLEVLQPLLNGKK